MDPREEISTGPDDKERIRLTANTSDLGVGTHEAILTISARRAANGPVDVPITVIIDEPPSIDRFPESLEFEATKGALSPVDTRVIAISNSGGQTLNWTAEPGASWISLEPGSGTSGGEDEPISVTVSVDTTGLAAGDYKNTIRILAPGSENTPQEIQVNLKVNSPPPEISLGQEEVVFVGTEGGTNPENQVVTVWNSGGDILEWSALIVQDAPWLKLGGSISVSRGENDRDELVLTADISDLEAGEYSTILNFTSESVETSKQINVILSLDNPLPSNQPEIPTVPATPSNVTVLDSGERIIWPDDDSISTNVLELESPTQEQTRPEIDFPLGSYEFIIEGVEDGHSDEIRISLPPDATVNTFYAFGRTEDNPTPHWYEFLFDGNSGAEILGNEIVIHLTDGQRGDDLIENGRIILRGAPGLDFLADLSLGLSGVPSVVNMGTTFEYILTIRNTGPGTATNVNLNNSVSDGLTLESIEPSQGRCLQRI